MVRPILRFWDSPAPQSAHDLQQRGCLLNTSVMIGRVAVFLELFESVWKRESPRPSLETISARLSAVDCSSLLKANAARLLVLPVREQSFSTGP
jgi:hypothetical protein